MYWTGADCAAGCATFTTGADVPAGGGMYAADAEVCADAASGDVRTAHAPLTVTVGACASDAGLEGVMVITCTLVTGFSSVKIT